MRYVEPTVTLISFRDHLGFYLWMKSRAAVITDTEGNKFMYDVEYQSGWMDNLPSYIYVGGKGTYLEDYHKKISKMNLQYNDAENLVFEIQGSCLFRDILFNIQGVNPWAQSNRFLFSILGEDKVYDEDMYPISAEYRGIPEWEAQFKKYMDLIKNDPIVDHNRVEMPYSISSTFWISLSHKTLLDVLSYLKNYAPLFYNIYGVKLGKYEDNIPDKPSAAVTQHRLVSPQSFKEGTTTIDGTVILNAKVGLILYSQFIRQANARISGLLNRIEHVYPEDFIHTVFKGDTLIDTNYVASVEVLISTIKTRLCAFAMSSGYGPCSWSTFIERFLPDLLDTPDGIKEFKEMLPCTFYGDRLIDCKFREDIKFRDNGVEKSNCPCPLYSKSMTDAKEKLKRDDNKIGYGFYTLTDYLINFGLRHHWTYPEIWTSKLEVLTDVELPEKLQRSILRMLSKYEDMYLNHQMPTEIAKFTEMYPDGDFTCAMKGLAIDRMSEILDRAQIYKYIINFGGDIYCSRVDAEIRIEGTNFVVNTSHEYDYSIFTSGNNTERRGDHIMGCKHGCSGTVAVMWAEDTERRNYIVDIRATKLAAGELAQVKSLENNVGVINAEYLNFEGDMLTNDTYIASPFFNPDQVKVRDAMESKFKSAFRPDLTDESKYYDANPNPLPIDVRKVVMANIKGITTSDFLVYPKRTDDLGTLFEVGRAMAEKKNILIYDEEKDEYHLHLQIEFAHKPGKPNGSYLFNCANKKDVISLGVASKYLQDSQIFYTLQGKKDNIMLSSSYTHVEDFGDKYYKIKRDVNERDR